MACVPRPDAGRLQRGAPAVTTGMNTRSDRGQRVPARRSPSRGRGPACGDRLTEQDGAGKMTQSGVYSQPRLTGHSPANRPGGPVRL